MSNEQKPLSERLGEFYYASEVKEEVQELEACLAAFAAGAKQAEADKQAAIDAALKSIASDPLAEAQARIAELEQTLFSKDRDIDAKNIVIETLHRQLEEARKDAPDAKRYRWLRGGKGIPAYSVRWARWEVREWSGVYWSTLFSEQLDTAIDAAMNKDQEENEQ